MATRCSLSNGKPLLALLVLSLLLIPRAVLASEELVFEVAQPVWTEEGVSIMHTTYAGYGGDWCSAVEFTCRANAVVSDQGVENRNAANRMGLYVDVRRMSKPETNWIVDTLDVALNVRRGLAHDEEGADGARMVIEKTVACLLENASNCLNPGAVMRLRVVGSAAFRNLGGTFIAPPRTEKDGAPPAALKKISG